MAELLSGLPGNFICLVILLNSYIIIKERKKKRQNKIKKMNIKNTSYQPICIKKKKYVYNISK